MTPRYRCFGDGLCCTDIHAIGPITRAEVKRLPLANRNPAIGMVVTPRDGRCSNLDPGERGCGAYDVRPSVCRRFPYRVIATPLGRRIGTEHRCPCRTLGDRPPIDPCEVLASIGRTTTDVVVGKTIRWTRRQRIPFERYVSREAEILARPFEGEPFPALEDVTWNDVAHHYRGKLDGSACGEALAWFGDIVLSLHGHDLRHLRARPWSPAFDRAEARTTIIEPAESVLADWIADEIWGLEWTERGSFDDARRDLATRLAVAREVVRRLIAEGVREDRAAAEAVLIGEMAGAAPLYRSVVRAFR